MRTMAVSFVRAILTIVKIVLTAGHFKRRRDRARARATVALVADVAAVT